MLALIQFPIALGGFLRRDNRTHQRLVIGTAQANRRPGSAIVFNRLSPIIACQSFGVGGQILLAFFLSAGGVGITFYIGGAKGMAATPTGR